MLLLNFSDIFRISICERIAQIVLFSLFPSRCFVKAVRSVWDWLGWSVGIGERTNEHQITRNLHNYISQWDCRRENGRCCYCIDSAQSSSFSFFSFSPPFSHSQLTRWIGWWLIFFDFVSCSRFLYHAI